MLEMLRGSPVEIAENEEVARFHSTSKKLKSKAREGFVLGGMSPLGRFTDVCSAQSPKKLKDLPALIEVYVDIVDRVMKNRGFDVDLCEFSLVSRRDNALFCATSECLIELTRRRARDNFLELRDTQGAWIHPSSGGRPGLGGVDQLAFTVGAL